MEKWSTFDGVGAKIRNNPGEKRPGIDDIVI